MNFMPIRANALAVMAKVPIPGTVKTRLTPPLTEEQACDLYRALLLDQLDNLTALSDVDLYIAFTPADAAEFFADLAPPAFQCFPQRGADLGARMNEVFTELRRRGHQNLALIGADLPALPLEIFRRAFADLDSSQVVLGPSQDGGYYLVGMSRPTPAIFSGMTWSHDEVLAQTVAKLREGGIAFALLPQWFDIDSAADVERLRGLSDCAGQIAMKRTRSCLRQLLNDAGR